VKPVATGSFLAYTQPNPFKNHVNLTFALPEAGPVTVEIYSADGRRVKTLANGTLAAGQHTLSWKLDDETPSGVYFYRVLAGKQESTGKITRVD
jgi:flagellar hook assembly protein FlgD